MYFVDINRDFCLLSTFLPSLTMTIMMVRRQWPWPSKIFNLVCTSVILKETPGLAYGNTHAHAHAYIHTFGFCLTGPFFWNYSKTTYSRLGQSPKVNFWELGIVVAEHLQARCLSCCLSHSIKALATVFLLLNALHFAC